MIEQRLLLLGDLLFQKYKDGQIKIKDHFKLVRGKTPPTKNPQYYENGISPWLNGGALTNLYFLTDYTEPSKLINLQVQENCKLLKAKPRSIIFSNVNTDKKRLVWVNSSLTQFYLGEHIWQIDNSNELTTATLFFALRQLNFDFCSNGSIFKEVKALLFMNMKINWVSDPTKQRIFLALLNNGVSHNKLTNYE